MQAYNGYNKIWHFIFTFAPKFHVICAVLSLQSRIGFIKLYFEFIIVESGSYHNDCTSFRLSVLQQRNNNFGLNGRCLHRISRIYITSSLSDFRYL
ncbi:4781_t:CDS:2 [Funneliformis mosseae]|uniref:4781_t:CDS:1 n=1 Tax=Funneliformis mosseae TaxID=27381 RepID=A0A9N9GLY9_FUNMO|nr:4781_t:CDS:2 [Funneliformis mosseae]